MKVFSRLAAGAATAAALLSGVSMALAGLGQPSPWQMGLQDSATPIMDDITRFHNFLLWIIAAISVFVLVLLLIIIVRFNARANPTPSRTTHNTVLEVLWTIVPVIILAPIAVPVVPAPVRGARRAEAGSHHKGDRQAVVLDLQLSRQRQFRVQFGDGPRARTSSPASRAC